MGKVGLPRSRSGVTTAEACVSCELCRRVVCVVCALCVARSMGRTMRTIARRK